MVGRGAWHLAAAWLGRLADMGGRLYGAACTTRRHGRPLRQALLAAAVVIPAVLWYDRDAFPHDRPVGADRHARISLEIAVNRHRLGEPSALYRPSSNTAGVRALLLGTGDVLTERLLDLPDRVEASPEDYAAGVKPFVNNENSLMLLDWALLRLAPGLRVGSLARAHMAVKAACLGIFVLLLLWAGISPLLAGAALHLGLLVVAKMNETHPVSVYPLLGPAVLLYLAVLGLALAAGAHRRAWAAAAALAGAGLAAGFLVNLRTSYAPLAACLLLLYLLAAALDLRRRGASAVRAGLLACLAVAAFAGGYRTFTAACIEPLWDAAAGCPYAYHVIGHPLVLGLANVDPPHDELARREGITFSDLQGVELARRIDPQVTYLDEHYDAALLAYYAKLWLYYPGEMRDLYAAKLDVAGIDGLRYLSGLAAAEKAAGTHGVGRLGGRLSWPLRLLPVGSQWLVAFGVLALMALLAGRSLGAAAAFALAGLAASAALLLLEATAFLPRFCLTYHSLLLLLVLLAGLAPYQVALDTAGWLARQAARLVRRTTAKGDGDPAGSCSPPARVAA